jgi:hypothetical protein
VSDELNLEPLIPEPDRLPRRVGHAHHSLKLRVWSEGRVVHRALSGVVRAAVWRETLDAFYAQSGGRVTCLDVSRAVLAIPPPPPIDGALGRYEAIVASARRLVPTHRIDQPSCLIGEGDAQLDLLRPLSQAISVLSFECVVFALHHGPVARAWCKAVSEQPWRH